jgi:hypothetical protein
MNDSTNTARVLMVVTVLFLSLAVAFILDKSRHLASRPAIPLVDSSFTSNATVRVSYSEMIRAKADLSDFDCYTCHERNKPPVLRFDDKHNLLIPTEHSDIVMGHGSHNRNNLCFNCHDETNLEQFQTRDGRQLKLTDSTPLCGSCHGPTYRDWEAGAHGRTSGYWNRELGTITRVDCVSCHNPHAPRFPSRKPAPGPHPLRPAVQTAENGNHH